MRSLDLDYVQAKSAGGWARWALLALAVAFSADVATTYMALYEDIEHKETRLARLTRSAPDFQEPRIVAASFTESELLAARDTIRRIATPWDELFQALEAAQTEGAALLSIEPDAEGGSVLLTGEARDYLKMLSYALALASVKTLKNVHLLRHETKQSDPQRPVAFALSASWREHR